MTVPPPSPKKPAGAPHPRRPYEKPRLLFEEPLELFATVCNPPAKSTVAMCSSGPISS